MCAFLLRGRIRDATFCKILEILQKVIKIYLDHGIFYCASKQTPNIYKKSQHCRKRLYAMRASKSNSSHGLYTGMVLLDLQKAFDTVSHDILCNKLWEWDLSLWSGSRHIILAENKLFKSTIHFLSL